LLVVAQVVMVPQATKVVRVVVPVDMYKVLLPLQQVSLTILQWAAPVQIQRHLVKLL
jgi:hypothetical protein